MKRVMGYFISIQNNNKFMFWTWIALTIFATIVGDIIAPKYFASYTKSISNKNTFELIEYFALMYILLQFLQIIFWRIAMVSLAIVEYKSMETIAKKSVYHLLELSGDFFKNNFVGSLVGKVNKFVRACERMFDESTALIRTLIDILFIVPILLIKMPLIGLAVIVLGIIFAFVNSKISRWVQKYNNESNEYDSKLTGVISDQLSNISTTHSFGMIEEEQRKFDYWNEIRTQKRKAAWLRDTARWGIIDGFKFIMQISSIMIALYYLKQNRFSLEEVIILSNYITTIAERLSNIGNVIKNFKQSQSDSEEMLEILSIKSSVVDNGKLSLSGNGDIYISKISFDYIFTTAKNGKRPLLPDWKPTIEDFSLTIKKGEKIGIVGASGSGKSTLINLMMRQMDVSDGEILFGDVNIKDLPLRSLRHQIALVAQDPSLFHRSILDNIRYGRPDASFDEVADAAKKAQAYDFIIKTKDGFDTKVGERGVKLSGGQRQRIALARAFLADRPVMILDEATSSLDSLTELSIQKAIDEMLKGENTMICIAHRLSTVAKMDRIIVMDHGKIIEQGTHSELLAKDGEYKKLVNAQQLHGLLNDDTVKSIPRYFLGIFPRNQNSSGKNKISIYIYADF